jgi:multidrug resistance protein MdtO
LGAIAQSLPDSSRRFGWLWEFFKSELAPYPGRAALVARMVTASTLMMIICMTFKIPYAAYAALFALTISRESIEGTTAAARQLVVGSALGGAYIIISLMLVVGNALLRFMWVGATLFLAFYAISALSNYAASARFAYLIIIIIPFVDSHASAESKVENTLWAVGAIALGSVITLLMEIAFAALRRTDDLVQALSDRLVSVAKLLAYYSDDRPVDAAAQSAIARLATVGTSRLRKLLQRASYEPRREQQLAAMVALVGRLVDLAANIAQFTSRVAAEDRSRIRKVAQDVGEIRIALESGRALLPSPSPSGTEAPSGLPLLGEVEKTVSLIQEVLTGAQSPAVSAPPPSADHERAKPLVPGALSNPEHIKFALRGCLAASLCYIIYNSLFWPGIATSVVTCMLTALTTVGASHQKQLLRFAGALVGGVVIGMGAQIFILPYIDSIGAFTVLFSIVAAIAAWFATASARLSYFGVQIAVAFYLINLEEFKIQTSLAVARDRVVGILLGLAMMWIAFDLLWSAPAATQIRRTLATAIRSLAQLAREPASPDLPAAIERSYALREMINSNFDKVRSLGDGVLFEFGPSRQQNLAWRDRIKRWQPQLRTLFVMRTASLKYRLQLPGFELPEAVRLSQQAYDARSAGVLDDLANRIEGGHPLEIVPRSEHLLQPLEQTLRVYLAEEPRQLTEARAESFSTLLHGIDRLTASVAEEVSKEVEVTA